MKKSFWYNRSIFEQEKYMKLLTILGKLSSLFSNNNSPYLYYRIHEKLFCEVFKAYDLSRGDISFDAKKDFIGIGLKTFLHQNGNTFQKISEFNADNHILRDLSSDREIVNKVSFFRNTRLQNTLNQTETTTMLYSIITREEGLFNIVEYPMNFIQIEDIKNIKSNKNTIHFDDGLHQYSFSKSKSTLLKKFIINKKDIIAKVPIEILENPFDLLEQINFEIGVKIHERNIGEEIFLPLYSSKTGKVENGSGLNQWNAGGRRRDEDEVYIPIPKFIHKEYTSFFNYIDKDTPPFKVLLPNGKEISCKVCQSGGKALMSNPNKDLGKWILRTVLDIPNGVLVTKEMLDDIGIDSIKMTKLGHNIYSLDFAKTGSFEEFRYGSKKNEKFN